MLEALSTLHNRRIALVLSTACAAFSLGALIVGVDDHGPGILLAFLAAVLVCPPAFLIGIAGALATFNRGRHRSR